MPQHREQKILPYTTSQLFELVADIEKYPDFLPWCRAARVIERGEGEFLGELVISYHHLTESYTSKVTLTPPTSVHSPARIDVKMVKGPFSHLTNEWAFTPEGEQTRIDFYLDFAFRSRLLDKLLGGFFTKMTHKMVSAFTQQAERLYS